MEDIEIRMDCSESKTYCITDMDWFRFQTKILKHIARNKSQEKWEDIFGQQEIQKLIENLKKKKCPGFSCSRKAIGIGLCMGCGLCETDELHRMFRQKIYDYIQNAIKRESSSREQSRHYHAIKGLLCIITQEGVSIRLKRNHQEYSFRTVFIGSGESDRFINVYLKAVPASRHLILKDIALYRAKLNNCTIHYVDNFRK